MEKKKIAMFALFVIGAMLVVRGIIYEVPYTGESVWKSFEYLVVAINQSIYICSGVITISLSFLLMKDND